MINKIKTFLANRKISNLARIEKAKRVHAKAGKMSVKQWSSENPGDNNPFNFAFSKSNKYDKLKDAIDRKYKIL